MQNQSLPSSAGVSHRISHGNLHIDLFDEFDIQHSSAVLGLVQQHFDLCKRVFIDVSNVDKPNPLACGHFKASIHSMAPEPRKVFFKGKTGFALALNGHRVLIRPGAAVMCAHAHGPCAHQAHHEHHDDYGNHSYHGHVCKNNCPNCKCKNKITFNKGE